MVDPQTCSDEQLAARMTRFAKFEPTFMAAMIDSEQNYWVPKREIPIPVIQGLTQYH